MVSNGSRLHATGSLRVEPAHMPTYAHVYLIGVNLHSANIQYKARAPRERLPGTPPGATKVAGRNIMDSQIPGT